MITRIDAPLPNREGLEITVTYCEEKLHLAAEFKIRTLEFSKAVSDLYEMLGSFGETEYPLLAVAADLARLKAEHARLALDAEHRCEEKAS